VAIQIRLLSREDERVLMNVAKDVFDNPIDPRLAREFLEDSRHHMAVSIDDRVVVGFASAVHYVHPDQPPQLWINEVSVASTHQRRGHGKAMLKVLFAVRRAQSCTVAWVLTDRTNSAAMALYSSLGGWEGADDEGQSDATLEYSFDL
jgi:ribosomal protein S18 acetylase RimI-like enzyme